LEKANKKTSISQFIPRASKELKSNMQDYAQFITAFEPVFRWGEQVVCGSYHPAFTNLTSF